MLSLWTSALWPAIADPPGSPVIAIVIARVRNRTLLERWCNPATSYSVERASQRPPPGRGRHHGRLAGTHHLPPEWRSSWRARAGDEPIAVGSKESNRAKGRLIIPSRVHQSGSTPAYNPRSWRGFSLPEGRACSDPCG